MDPPVSLRSWHRCSGLALCPLPLGCCRAGPCCSSVLGWFCPSSPFPVAWKQVEGTAQPGMAVITVHGWQPVIR